MKFAFIHSTGEQTGRGGRRLVPDCGCLAQRLCGAWRRRQSQPPTPYQQEKQQAEARVCVQIRAAYRTGRGYYGSPRVYDELRDQGIRVSRKRVAYLMRDEGLVGRSRGPRRVPTTESRHRYPAAPNLLERRFDPQELGGLNRFWCGDITYLPTQEGWLLFGNGQRLVLASRDGLGRR